MSFRSHPGCIEYTVQCVESRRVAPLLTKSHYTIFVAQRGFYKRPNMHRLELWNVRLEAHDCSMVLSKLRWHSTTTTFWRPFWSSTFSKSEFRTDFLVVVLMINLCFVDFVCHLCFMIRFDGQRAVYTWKNIFVMQKPCVIDISRTVDTVTYSVFCLSPSEQKVMVSESRVSCIILVGFSHKRPFGRPCPAGPI